MPKQGATEGRKNKKDESQSEEIYRNLSGFPIKPFYGHEDLSQFNASIDLGSPW